MMMYEYDTIEYEHGDETYTVFMADDESFVMAPALFGADKFADMREIQAAADELFKQWDADALDYNDTISHLQRYWD